MNSIRRNQDDQPKTYRCYEPPPQGYVDAKTGQSLGGTTTVPVGSVDYFLPIEQDEDGEEDSCSVSSNGGQCCCCCCGCCGLNESGGNGCRDACREISIHGLRRMVARRRKSRQRSSACRCFIWGVLLFVCLCAFVYTATDCVLLYLSEPLATKQTFRYEPMNRLPAITLCNLNPLRLSEMARQKLPITSHDAPADDDRRFVTWRDVNVSSLDVHLSASHRREKMIISCTLSNQPCDSSKYVKTLTELGLCFTLRPNASDLRLLLNAEQYEHYSFRGHEDDDDTGFLMVFHEPEINGPAVPVRTGMKLAPGRRASVGLRRTDVTLLSTRSTPCSQDGANSISHCVTSCEIDIISRHCGCRPFWAAVTDSKMRICSMTQHINCVSKRKQGEWLSSSSADCVCQTPCQFTEYHWDFSFSDLVSTSVLKPDALLSDSKLAEMNDDRCRAANIRSKSTKAIWRNDEEQISELVRSLDDVAYRVELFQVNLRVVAQHFHESVLALQARLAFHSYVGLAGMRKSFSEGFAKAFETVRERSLEALTSGFYERVAELERSIKQLMFTSTSESILRKVVYYMMDNQLSSKLEIAIQTLDNLTKVYYSFLNSDPSYATNLTPEKRYDAQLIPYEVLSEVQDSLKLCYGGISDNIAGLIDHILALKTILKDVFQRNALNETAFDHSKRAFVAGVLRVKEYVAMFEEKVIAKSIRSLNSKVEELDVLNRSLSDSLLIIVERLAHLQDELSDSYSGPYSQILSFSQLCQRYTQDDAAVKSSLAVTALDHTTESAMDLLRKILRRLKSGSGEVSELWRSAEDTIKTMWKRLLEEDALSDFYMSLYNDVKEMASHTQRADIYRGLFMNPMLLGMDEMRWSLQALGGRFGSSPSGTQANDFYAKLNADFPTMNYSSKMSSVEEELRRFDKETNFDAMLEGKNEKLENAFQTLHENLAEFQDQCRQNSHIVRDNVVLVDVRVVSNMIRNNNETSSFTLVTLFGQIGGLLALFLGASLVTCVEIIDVAFQCACPTGSRPKKTKSAKSSNSNHVLFKPVDMADHDSYALPVTSSMGDHQHGRNHNNKAPGSSANKIKVDATYQRKRGQEDAETDI